MNESGFSTWLCKHFREHGLFPQRLEVTTGAGVPDLAVLGYAETSWIELKWKTKHIRPEQYVWGVKAKQSGVTVNYIVGYEDHLELYFIHDAKKMTNSWKLTALSKKIPRKKAHMQELIEAIR